MKYFFNFLICCFLLIFPSKDIFATHAAGMDITFECVARNSTSDFYKITVSFYRDCNGSPAPGSLDMEYSCSNNLFFNETLLLASGPTYITPTCTQSGTPCSGTSGLVEIEEYKYEKLITLDHCDDWLFSVCIPNRNNAISTILQPGNEQLCVQAELNNLNFCNNSPIFTEYPAPYICVNEPFCFNNGAFDPDGDSLVYSLVTPLAFDFATGTIGNVQYLPGYSINSPITGTTTFDPSSGNLCMTATATEIGIVAMKISEYRNGVFIGSVIRDIQIIILPCTTVPPVLSGFNGNPPDVTTSSSMDDSLNLCADFGDTITFTIDAQIGSSNNKIMSWSGITSTSNATFNVTNNFSNNPSGTFFWVPQPSDAQNSPISFNITVQDDACPINNVFSYTYTITLSSSTTFSVNATVNDESCYGYGDGSIQLSVSGTDSIPTYDWVGPNGYTNINKDINGLRSGLYSLLLTDISGCYLRDSFYVTSPNPVNVSFSVDSITCSGFDNGAINTSTLGFSSFAEVTWSVWYPSNPTIGWGFVSNDEDIDSLSPGFYAIQIIDSINSNLCIFYDTIEIVEPNPYNASYNINQITCNNGSDGYIDLNVSGNNNSLVYSWNSSNGFSSSSQDIFQLSAGQYYINITNANGCLYNDTIELINPPELNSISNETRCYTYVWNGNTYDASGSYSWTGTNFNGCDSTATLNLTINDSSTVNINTSACNNYTWNGNTYNSSGTYYWNGINSLGCDSNVYLNLIINNESYEEVSISTCSTFNWNGTIYDESGTYYDTLTNIFGCDSVVKLSLNVSSFNISALSPVCEFDSTEVSISISYPTSNQYDIFINNNSYTIDSLGYLKSTGELIKIKMTNTNNLILSSIQDGLGCTSNPLDSAFVLVNDLPSVNILLDDICENIEPFRFNDAEPPGGEFFIDNQLTDTIFPSNLSLGNHVLSYFYIDSITGCSNSSDKEISVLEAPLADFSLTPQIGQTDSLITFTNLSSNFVDNSWSMGNGFSLSEDNSFTYSYPEFGQYYVELTVYGANNCFDVTSNYVTIYPTYSVYIPNSFSPDFDQINESFAPIGIGIFYYEMEIFNRWGQSIFKSENTPWDAENVVQGLYLYKIRLKDFNNRPYFYEGTIRVIK